MKWILLLFFLSSFHIVAHTACRKAFGRPIHPQFTETLLRYFRISNHSWRQQKAFEADLKSFATADKTREEILRYLIQKQHIKVKAKNYFSLPNPVFNSIINKTAEDTIALMKEDPNRLYDGTLLDLPPFFLMAHIGNQKIVWVALKMDPSLVHSRNIMKETPLHLAIDREIAEILLHYQANPNVQDKRGRTPIYNSRNPETVEFLLRHNADIKIRDRSGLSLTRYYAQVAQESSIINVLNQFKEKMRMIRIYGSSNRNANRTSQLLETEGSSENRPTRREIAERNREERKAKKQRKNDERKRLQAISYRRNIGDLEAKRLQRKKRKEQRRIEQQKTNLFQELKILRESEKKAQFFLKIWKSKIVINLLSYVFYPEQSRQAMEEKQRDKLTNMQQAISSINNQLQHLSARELELQEIQTHDRL